MNKSLIEKIENIIKLSSEFDKLCNEIIKSSNEANNNISNHVYNLTNLYMTLRAEHGSIILITFNYKNNLDKNHDNIKDNDLYDLSVLTQISDSVMSLMSNIEYQYKRISLVYPNLIKKNAPFLILFTNDSKNKFVNYFEQLKKKYNEYKYKVIKCDEIGSLVNCSKFLNKKLSIKIDKLPSMYLITDENMQEIPISKLESFEELEKFIN
jgi:hypothetical protein